MCEVVVSRGVSSLVGTSRNQSFAIKLSERYLKVSLSMVTLLPTTVIAVDIAPIARLAFSNVPWATPH